MMERPDLETTQAIADQLRQAAVQLLEFPEIAAMMNIASDTIESECDLIKTLFDRCEQ